MAAEIRQKRIHLLENVTHYLTAFVVLLKGLDKFALNKPAIGVTFCVFGIVILLGTLFHRKATRLLRHFKAYVLSVEAIIMTTIGYLYMAEGKQLIQYVCFFAAAMFLVALIILIRKHGRATELHAN